MTVVEEEVVAPPVAEHGNAPHAPNAPRLTRVVIDRPGRAVVIDLHPRLTIVGAKAGQEARLVELLDHAATGDSEGIHAELIDDTGRELVVFRPRGNRHRVVDVDTGQDLGQPGAWVWAAWSQLPAEVDVVDMVAHLAARNSEELWLTAQALVDEKLSQTSGQPAVVRQPAPRRRLWRRRPSTAARKDVLASQWRTLAGTIEPAIALSYRPVVEACAATLRRQGSLASVASSDAPLPPLVAAIAQAAAALCPRPDRLLSVVAFPPEGIEEDAALAALDVVTGQPLPGGQVVVVSSAAELADWARLETFAGRARWIDTIALTD